MMKCSTFRRTGTVHPFYRFMRGGLAAACAALLVITGGCGGIRVHAAESEETDTPDAQETGDGGSEARGVSVSASDDSSIAQDGSQEEAQESEVEGLYLGKYLTDNGDGTLQVTLESYVTGENVKVSTGTPVDVLLLLDASNSMTYSLADGTADGDGITRLEALQEGAEVFIETIKEQNTGLSEEDQSRIAIMGFNWSLTEESAREDNEGDADYYSRLLEMYPFLTVDGTDTSNADSLTAIIDDWGSCLGGGTPTGDAMETAAALLTALAQEYTQDGNRQQVIILFTDGWPTYENGGLPGYSVEQAAIALQAAYTLKQSGVEIYCVNVLTGIEAGEYDTLPEYEKEGAEGTYLAEDPVHYYSDGMNELQGFYQKGSDLYNLYVNTTDENVCLLQTRFMYLLSSDNPDADDIDDDGVTDGEYFYTAHDVDQLTEVFQTLAAMTGAAGVNLGTDTEIRDFVTDEFTIADVSAVTISTADYNGDGTWSEAAEIEDPESEGYSVAVNGSQLIVSGFDYAANYVSESPHPDSAEEYYGSKLIISFPIAVSSETFGGNCIPTNTADSGIYTDSSAEDPCAEFEIPCADVELTYAIAAEDAQVFVPDTADLESLLIYPEGYVPDGTNNAYVDIVYTMTDISGDEDILVGVLSIPAGESADSCSWVWYSGDGTAAACGMYRISCTVNPVTDGTYEEIMEEDAAEVHIYFPYLFLMDSLQIVGETADVQPGDYTDEEGLEEHLIRADWICSDGLSSDAEDEPAFGLRVRFSWGVECEDGTYVIASGGNIPIIIGVYRVSEDTLAEDITAYTQFEHDCFLDDCGYDLQEDEYTGQGVYCLIHAGVKTQEDAEDLSAEDTEDEESGEDPEEETDTDSGEDTEESSEESETTEADSGEDTEESSEESETAEEETEADSGEDTEESSEESGTAEEETGTDSGSIAEGTSQGTQDTGSETSVDDGSDFAEKITESEDPGDTEETDSSKESDPYQRGSGTGDPYEPLMWLLCAGAAAAGMAGILARLKRKEMRQ